MYVNKLLLLLCMYAEYAKFVGPVGPVGQNMMMSDIIVFQSARMSDNFPRRRIIAATIDS